MDDIELTLRLTKGAALTHEEVDDNFSALKAGIEQVNEEFTEAVTEISDTKAVPVGADGLLVRDSAAGNVMKLTTRAGLDTSIVGASLGTTGTVDLDLAALVGTVQTITLTGNPTFTTSNRAAGRWLELVLTAGGSNRTPTFPAGWVAFGAALPATLTAGKVYSFAIRCLGSADSNVHVAWVESV